MLAAGVDICYQVIAAVTLVLQKRANCKFPFYGPQGELLPLELELGDLDVVDEVAERLSAEPRLDALILCELQFLPACATLLPHAPLRRASSAAASSYHQSSTSLGISNDMACSVGHVQHSPRGHANAAPAGTRLSLHPRASNSCMCLAAGGGCCANPLSYTRHGFEEHIGVNHFGYAALVDALLPKLKSQVRARLSRRPNLAPVHSNVGIESLSSKQFAMRALPSLRNMMPSILTLPVLNK